MSLMLRQSAVAMERWSGKVALVTGASAGIGASIAEELVKKGLKVVGLARRSEKVEDLKKNLAGTPGQLFALKGDVSKPEDVDAAFKWIKEKFGTIHVLVNNAGIIRGGDITDSKFEVLQDVVNVNLLGLTKCTQKALQLMKESGVNDGHIININSVAGHIVPPFPGLNVYSATKHAVTALTETLRQELRMNKTKIRVTSISPGGVATEIFQAAKDASAELKIGIDLTAPVVEWPMLQSKDIADSVLYVLSTPPHVQVHEIIIKPLGEEI